MLRPDLAAALLRAAGVTDRPAVWLLKRHNHVFQLETGEAVYFLKCYTKDWYGDDAAGTGYHVDHEAAAYRLLARHGLAAPEVVAAEQTMDNALGRPYLITRALSGQPLTDILAAAQPAQRRAALRVVGEYLARMHAITLPYAGYLTSSGPAAPPDPAGWQHPIWTYAAFQKETLATWEAERLEVPEPLAARRQAMLAEHGPALAAAYATLRFTHGDCHAHQFFLEGLPEGGWRVTGVVDMEVASAGDSGADLVKFFLEVAGRLLASTCWWEDFFAGYGATDFALLKLRLAAAHHINYTCLGPEAWPGSRAAVTRHVLEATDWQTLLDTRRISEKNQI